MLIHFVHELIKSLVLHIPSLDLFAWLFNFSQVAVDINLDSPQLFDITEQMKMKAQELRFSFLFI